MAARGPARAPRQRTHERPTRPRAARRRRPKAAGADAPARPWRPSLRGEDGRRRSEVGGRGQGEGEPGSTPDGGGRAARERRGVWGGASSQSGAAGPRAGAAERARLVKTRRAAPAPLILSAYRLRTRNWRAENGSGQRQRAPSKSTLFVPPRPPWPCPWRLDPAAPALPGAAATVVGPDARTTRESRVHLPPELWTLLDADCGAPSAPKRRPTPHI